MRLPHVAQPGIRSRRGHIHTGTHPLAHLHAHVDAYTNVVVHTDTDTDMVAHADFDAHVDGPGYTDALPDAVRDLRQPDRAP